MCESENGAEGTPAQGQMGNPAAGQASSVNPPAGGGGMGPGYGPWGLGTPPGQHQGQGAQFAPPPPYGQGQVPPQAPYYPYQPAPPGPVPAYPGAPWPYGYGHLNDPRGYALPQGPWPGHVYPYPPPAAVPPMGQTFHGGLGSGQGPGAAAGHGAGRRQGFGMSQLVDEIAGGGSGLSSLSQMLNLDDKELWKGALIGAAAVLLLTNESVQNALFKGGVRARDAVKSGVDQVKSRAQTVGDEVRKTRGD